MKLDGVEAALNGGTLELETRDMTVAQRVLADMDKGENVILDATSYYPASIDVKMKSVVVPDTSFNGLSHKHAFRPVATITLRA